MSYETVPCPCCGDPMGAYSVVCWPCYRWTNRLTPGTYTDRGVPSEVTAVDIARWDEARRLRLPADVAAMLP